MILVFCLNTLIRVLECRKCILRGPNFKIFPGEHSPGPPLQAHPFGLRRTLSILSLFTQFFHLLKFLVKSLISVDSNDLSNWTLTEWRCVCCNNNFKTKSVYWTDWSFVVALNWLAFYVINMKSQCALQCTIEDYVFQIIALCHFATWATLWKLWKYVWN